MKQLKVRFITPAAVALHKKLWVDAKAHGKSLNSEILARLVESYEKKISLNLAEVVKLAVQGSLPDAENRMEKVVRKTIAENMPRPALYQPPLEPWFRTDKLMVM